MHDTERGVAIGAKMMAGTDFVCDNMLSSKRLAPSVGHKA